MLLAQLNFTEAPHWHLSHSCRPKRTTWQPADFCALLKCLPTTPSASFKPIVCGAIVVRKRLLLRRAPKPASKKPAPEKLNTEVVAEHHHAPNWLTGYGGTALI